MKVKVYSTSTCPWCNVTKDFLRKHNIVFEDINVGEDSKAAQEMVKKSGQRGVPVIDIDGTIIIGFNEQAIKKALKIN
ncbi:NrdH-redoxin [Candidatus Woesearchaeota archaeon RBG_13_36_6]|nr:MAG: NrdH-redoxin [Candidatus Woesearchaeota archaeon RBG_13_36_6]